MFSAEAAENTLLNGELLVGDFLLNFEAWLNHGFARVLTWALSVGNFEPSILDVLGQQVCQIGCDSSSSEVFVYYNMHTVSFPAFCLGFFLFDQFLVLGIDWLVDCICGCLKVFKLGIGTEKLDELPHIDLLLHYSLVNASEHTSDSLWRIINCDNWQATANTAMPR